MEIQGDVILDGRFSIIRLLRRFHCYYVYSALNIQNGDEVFIVEYFPEKATRDTDGFVVIPDDFVKTFDRWVNSFVSGADNVMKLPVNEYLKVLAAFDEGGTGYVVTDKIDGISITDFIDKRQVPLRVEDAAPIFFELLAVFGDTALRQGIFYNVSPDTMHITAQGKIRISYFYECDYNNKKAAYDMAALFYYLISGLMPAEDQLPDVDTESMEEREAELASAVVHELRNDRLTTMQALYDELVDVYSGRNEPPPMELRESLKTGFLTAAFIAALLCTAAVLSFMLAGALIGDPIAAKREAQEAIMEVAPIKIEVITQ